MAPKYDVTFIGPVQKEIRTEGVNTTLETAKVSGDYSFDIGGGLPYTGTAMAKLGLSILAVSSFGIGSENYQRKLRAKGIKPLVEEHPEVEQDTSLVIQSEDGRKAITHFPGSYTHFSREFLEIHADEIVDTRLIHISTFANLPEGTIAYLKQLYGVANTKGVITTMDMGRIVWDEDMKEHLDGFLYNTCILSANEKELYGLARGDGDDFTMEQATEIEEYMTLDRVVEFAHRILDSQRNIDNRTMELVNVHYGSRGTVLVSQDQTTHMEPSFEPELVIPTGTGNSQNAGVFYGWLQGWDLEKIARFANASAGLWLGGQQFPSLEEIEAKM